MQTSQGDTSHFCSKWLVALRIPGTRPQHSPNAAFPADEVIE